MRPITCGVHRVLDLVTVAVFALAPRLLGLTGLPALLSYALAMIHLTLTLFTEFADQTPRPIPLAVHGLIETIVGPALVLLPLVAGWTGAARYFYLAAGVTIIIVRVLTDYHPTSAHRAS